MPIFFALWDEVINLPNKQPEAAYQVLIGQLGEIEKSRNLSASIAQERLSKAEWITLLFLAVIIVLGIFQILQSGTMFNKINFVLLPTVLILILLILRDFSRFMLGGSALLEESGQEVLEAIGKPRYYNSFFVKRGISKVPKSVRQYRLGLHTPGSPERQIKFVDLDKTST